MCQGGAGLLCHGTTTYQLTCSIQFTIGFECTCLHLWLHLLFSELRCAFWNLNFFHDFFWFFHESIFDFAWYTLKCNVHS